MYNTHSWVRGWVDGCAKHLELPLKVVAATLQLPHLRVCLDLRLGHLGSRSLYGQIKKGLGWAAPTFGQMPQWGFFHKNQLTRPQPPNQPTPPNISLVQPNPVPQFPQADSMREPDDGVIRGKVEILFGGYNVFLTQNAAFWKIISDIWGNQETQRIFGIKLVFGCS